MLKSLLIILFLSQTLSYNWTNVQNYIYSAINDGKFTGCVLAVADNETLLFHKAYGTISSKYGLYAPPVTIKSKFDINFLTQVIATNSALMDLIDIRKLHPSHRVGAYISAYEEVGKLDVKVEDLLLHNSGLEPQYLKTYPKTSDELLKAINSEKLIYSTGTKTVISQLGYIILGEIAQQLGKKQIPALIQFAFQYLGMNDTTFMPADIDQIVPGGYTHEVCRGSNFNKAAAFLGGVAGHSGLFSTSSDLVKYMQMMINKGKVPNKKALLFSQETIEQFLTVKTYKQYKNTRALGWETVPLNNPPCGKKFSASPDSFGLSDVSGSYIWADKKKNVIISFLANGHYPSLNFHPVEQFQGQLSDIIMTVLGH